MSRVIHLTKRRKTRKNKRKTDKFSRTKKGGERSPVTKFHNKKDVPIYIRDPKNSSKEKIEVIKDSGNDNKWSTRGDSEYQIKLIDEDETTSFKVIDKEGKVVDNYEIYVGITADDNLIIKNEGNKLVVSQFKNPRRSSSVSEGHETLFSEIKKKFIEETKNEEMTWIQLLEKADKIITENESKLKEFSFEDVKTLLIESLKDGKKELDGHKEKEEVTKRIDNFIQYIRSGFKDFKNESSLLGLGLEKVKGLIRKMFDSKKSGGGDMLSMDNDTYSDSDLDKQINQSYLEELEKFSLEAPEHKEEFDSLKQFLSSENLKKNGQFEIIQDFRKKIVSKEDEHLGRLIDIFTHGKVLSNKVKSSNPATIIQTGGSPPESLYYEEEHYENWNFLRDPVVSLEDMKSISDRQLETKKQRNMAWGDPKYFVPKDSHRQKMYNKREAIKRNRGPRDPSLIDTEKNLTEMDKEISLQFTNFEKYFNQKNHLSPEEQKHVAKQANDILNNIKIGVDFGGVVVADVDSLKTVINNIQTVAIDRLGSGVLDSYKKDAIKAVASSALNSFEDGDDLERAKYKAVLGAYNSIIDAFAHSTLEKVDQLDVLPADLNVFVNPLIHALNGVVIGADASNRINIDDIRGLWTSEDVEPPVFAPSGRDTIFKGYSDKVKKDIHYCISHEKNKEILKFDSWGDRDEIIYIDCQSMPDSNVTFFKLIGEILDDRTRVTDTYERSIWPTEDVSNTEKPPPDLDHRKNPTKPYNQDLVSGGRMYDGGDWLQGIQPPYKGQKINLKTIITDILNTDDSPKEKYRNLNPENDLTDTSNLAEHIINNPIFHRELYIELLYKIIARKNSASWTDFQKSKPNYPYFIVVDDEKIIDAPKEDPPGNEFNLLLIYNKDGKYYLGSFLRENNQTGNSENIKLITKFKEDNQEGYALDKCSNLTQYLGEVFNCYHTFNTLPQKLDYIIAAARASTAPSPPPPPAYTKENMSNDCKALLDGSTVGMALARNCPLTQARGYVNNLTSTYSKVKFLENNQQFYENLLKDLSQIQSRDRIPQSLNDNYYTFFQHPNRNTGTLPSGPSSRDFVNLDRARAAAQRKIVDANRGGVRNIILHYQNFKDLVIGQRYFILNSVSQSSWRFNESMLSLLGNWSLREEINLGQDIPNITKIQERFEFDPGENQNKEIASSDDLKLIFEELDDFLKLFDIIRKVIIDLPSDDVNVDQTDIKKIKTLKKIVESFIRLQIYYQKYIYWNIINLGMTENKAEEFNRFKEQIEELQKQQLELLAKPIRSDSDSTKFRDNHLKKNFLFNQVNQSYRKYKDIDMLGQKSNYQSYIYETIKSFSDEQKLKEYGIYYDLMRICEDKIASIPNTDTYLLNNDIQRFINEYNENERKLQWDTQIALRSKDFSDITKKLGAFKDEKIGTIFSTEPLSVLGGMEIIVNLLFFLISVVTYLLPGVSTKFFSYRPILTRGLGVVLTNLLKLNLFKLAFFFIVMVLIKFVWNSLDFEKIVGTRWFDFIKGIMKIFQRVFEPVLYLLQLDYAGHAKTVWDKIKGRFSSGVSPASTIEGESVSSMRATPGDVSRESAKINSSTPRVSPSKSGTRKRGDDKLFLNPSDPYPNDDV